MPLVQLLQDLVKDYTFIYFLYDFVNLDLILPQPFLLQMDDTQLFQSAFLCSAPSFGLFWLSLFRSSLSPSANAKSGTTHNS